MKRYLYHCRSINSHLMSRLLVAIALGSIILAVPSIGFAAEAAQVTIVIVPINMAFPLLPTMMVIVDNPGTKTDGITVFESGSSGAGGIIRVSGKD
jgi:hypothetical protein